MSHTPTPEQQAIIDFYLSRSEPLIINALAGAAKTTTLTMLAAADPGQTVLAIAFNKHIATELAQRMPSNCICKTMNALGHRMVGDFLSRRVTLRTDKKRDLLKAFIDGQSQKDKELLYDNYSDISQAIAAAANHGYIPEKTHSAARPLYDEAQFFEMLGTEFASIEIEAIDTVTRQSIELALRGEIDFSDQLLIPACFPISFQPFNVTLIDEAQDLSAVQHAMLRKTVGRKSRLIAVGDRFQAIYAFRGADEMSMSTLESMFNMASLSLSTSFRLPKRLADHVRWRAPTIASPTWAIEGELSHLEEWHPTDIPDGAAIICRNNAPLLRVTFALLRNGRRPKLLGNDVMKGLIRDLKKLSDDMSLTKDHTLPLIKAWEDEKLKRYRGAKHISDKADCMRLFVDSTESLGLAVAKAEMIAKLEGTITLCTGHKSKGLEWNDVFFLDEFLIDTNEAAGQELNLRYVIATRAKRRLTYIRTQDMII